MLGLMQHDELTVDEFLVYAERWHGRTEVVSRCIDGAIERADHNLLRSYFVPAGLRHVVCSEAGAVGPMKRTRDQRGELRPIYAGITRHLRLHLCP